MKIEIFILWIACVTLFSCGDNITSLPHDQSDQSLIFSENNCENVLVLHKKFNCDSSWKYAEKAKPKIEIFNTEGGNVKIVSNLPYEPLFYRIDSLFKKSKGSDYYVRINHVGSGVLPGQLIILNEKYLMVLQYEDYDYNRLIKMSKYYLESTNEEHYSYNFINTNKITDLDINHIQMLQYDTLIAISRTIDDESLILKKNKYYGNSRKFVEEKFIMKSDFSLFWWINCPHLICRIGKNDLYYSAATLN